MSHTCGIGMWCRQVLCPSESIIACFSIFKMLKSHFSERERPLLGKNMKRKFQKKSPDVSLGSIYLWFEFQNFSSLSWWMKTQYRNSQNLKLRSQKSCHRHLDVIQKICERRVVLYVFNYRTVLVVLLCKTTSFCDTVLSLTYRSSGVTYSYGFRTSMISYCTTRIML